MFIFKITPKAMEIRNFMFFCVVTLAWPLEMGKKSLEADPTEEPSHCSHLDTPSREEAAQLERPPGWLFASALFWDGVLMSPKPSAFGGNC